MTGETPVVDVQSTRREIALDNETIRSIPRPRSYSYLLTTVPGLQTNHNNVNTGPLFAIFPIHGGRGVESRLTVDGLNVSNPPGGQPAVELRRRHRQRGGSDDSDVGRARRVRDGRPHHEHRSQAGRQQMSGMVFFSGFSEGMQANNFDDELRSKGVLAADAQHVYDFNAAVGGPIRRDSLWYYVSALTQGQKQNTLNLHENVTPAIPTRWTYVADLTNPAYSDRTWENYNARITWQATTATRSRCSGMSSRICRKCTGTTSFSGSPSPTTSPEADGYGDYYPQRTQQAKWTSPLTNRLLLEAGIGTSMYQWGNRERPDNVTHDLVRVTNFGPNIIVPASGSTPAVVINNLTPAPRTGWRR